MDYFSLFLHTFKRLGIDSLFTNNGSLADSPMLSRPLMADFWYQWLERIINFGIKVVLAIILFLIGRKVVGFVQRYFSKLIDRTHIDANLKSLSKNLVLALLYIILFVFITNIIGFRPVSFAALIASLGVGIGMGLSGQLQNFAGGIIILVTRPFTIGDYIVAQSVEGTVRSLSLFHTIIKSPDNKTIYIPNGALSNNVVTNLSQENLRRNEWVIGVDYDTDFDFVKQVLIEIVNADKRILQTPAPFIALKKLNDSSVDIIVRAWCQTSELWDVFFDINKTIYAEFNKRGIGFPFPQLTIHPATPGDKLPEA